MKNTLIVLGVMVVAGLLYLGMKSMYVSSDNASSNVFASTVPTNSSGLPMGTPTDLIPPSPTESPSI